MKSKTVTFQAWAALDYDTNEVFTILSENYKVKLPQVFRTKKIASAFGTPVKATFTATVEFPEVRNAKP